MTTNPLSDAIKQLATSLATEFVKEFQTQVASQLSLNTAPAVAKVTVVTEDPTPKETKESLAWERQISNLRTWRNTTGGLNELKLKFEEKEEDLSSNPFLNENYTQEKAEKLIKSLEEKIEYLKAVEPKTEEEKADREQVLRTWAGTIASLERALHPSPDDMNYAFRKLNESIQKIKDRNQTLNAIKDSNIRQEIQAQKEVIEHILAQKAEATKTNDWEKHIKKEIENFVSIKGVPFSTNFGDTLTSDEKEQIADNHPLPNIRNISKSSDEMHHDMALDALKDVSTGS